MRTSRTTLHSTSTLTARGTGTSKPTLQMRRKRPSFSIDLANVVPPAVARTTVAAAAASDADASLDRIGLGLTNLHITTSTIEGAGEELDAEMAAEAADAVLDLATVDIEAAVLKSCRDRPPTPYFRPYKRNTWLS